jgi:hypothetical protein
MNSNFCRLITFALVGLLPIVGLAQSDSTEPSLGDIARALRKNKAAAPQAAITPARPVIDNENFDQVVNDVERKRLDGKLLFSLDRSGNDFQVSAADVTCSLSFSSKATSLLSNAYAPQDLPRSELLKLDGPASISGDAIEVSVHNGSTWNVKEITVGFSVVRRDDTHSAQYGSARLIPAAETMKLTTEKRSDVTMLYHLKGSAAPSSTTTFRETLGLTLADDQDWHWSILAAKGSPAARNNPTQ